MLHGVHWMSETSLKISKRNFLEFVSMCVIIFHKQIQKSIHHSCQVGSCTVCNCWFFLCAKEKVSGPGVIPGGVKDKQGVWGFFVDRFAKKMHPRHGNSPPRQCSRHRARAEGRGPGEAKPQSNALARAAGKCKLQQSRWQGQEAAGRSPNNSPGREVKCWQTDGSMPPRKMPPGGLRCAVRAVEQQ